MKKLLIILLILFLIVCGLYLGPKLAAYQGYVLIVLEQGTLQMSVLGSLLVLTLGLISLAVLAWLVLYLYGVLSNSQKWFFGFNRRKQRNAFRQGLLALAEGDSQNAIKQLNKVTSSDFSALNLLANAEAHLQQGNPEQAMILWQQAAEHPKAQLAADLQRMRHYMQTQRPEQTLALINTLSEKQQKHPKVIRLWAGALAANGDWQALNQHLAGWKKALGKDYDYFWQQASRGNFAQIASSEGANQLKQTWQALPRATRNNPAQQAAYIQQLIDQGMHLDAEQALVDYQKKQLQDELFPLFKKLKIANPIASLRFLEQAIKRDSDNAALYSTLGHLAYQGKDLDLAEKSLAKAIQLANQAEDVLLLAEVSEAKHNAPQALQLYKQSAQGNKY